MSIDEIYKCSKVIKNDGVLFYYNGYLSQKILENIGDAIKCKLLCEGVKKVLIRKVFAILVEQVQNILKYSSKKISIENREISEGVIILGNDKSNFFLECGNSILNEDIKYLNDELQKLQKMTKDELKTYYREKLKAESTSVNGAGIGLIDIAKNSSLPIEFQIKKDGEKSFFSLKAFI